MKRLFVVVSCLLAHVKTAEAQVQPRDTIDDGVPDTISLSCPALPSASQGQKSFVVECRFVVDVDTVGALSIGFRWDNRAIHLDSAIATPQARDAFNFFTYFYRSNNRDSSNLYRNMLFAGASFKAVPFSPLAQSVVLARYYFTAENWNEQSVVVFDTLSWNYGSMPVIATRNGGHRPTWGGQLIVQDVNRPCCIGNTGNIDLDAKGAVDIADQMLLVDHLFIGQQPLPCPAQANVDGSPNGAVDIGDLTFLIGVLFQSNGALAPCN